MIMVKRAKFLKIYANVPDTLREDILVMVNQQPYTWNTAFLEVRNNTLLGKKIIKALEEMRIL